MLIDEGFLSYISFKNRDHVELRPYMYVVYLPLFYITRLSLAPVNIIRINFCVVFIDYLEVYIYK